MTFLVGAESQTLTMDQLTVSLQQARALSFLSQSLQVFSQFAVLLVDDDDDDRQKRKKKAFLQQRCRWDRFVFSNQDQPLFRRHLRMTYGSFVGLLDKIQTYLPVVDEKMGALRGGVIVPELQLYATLRYLAGASYSDICVFCRMSKTTFYKVLWNTINAINKAITIDFPSTVEDCALLAASFERISFAGVISNCVGVLDGYLLPIITPWKSQAKNVRSYFSGHYQRYGINIQACCDAHCRFTFVGIGGPGVTKDRSAVKESGLSDLIEALPSGYVCIADCAYQPSEKLVPVFGGDLALQRDNDNFNYFASQLRIRIEMAFGLMTRKWGILQRPLCNSLFSIKHLICCIARLHNYCIEQRLLQNVNTSSDSLLFDTHSSLSSTQLAFMDASAQVSFIEECKLLLY